MRSGRPTGSEANDSARGDVKTVAEGPTGILDPALSGEEGASGLRGFQRGPASVTGTVPRSLGD